MGVGCSDEVITKDATHLRKPLRNRLSWVGLEKVFSVVV